ncbi:hypothetical protein [Rhizobium sp. LjRoot258]|uniref:hypothetical protein n=1 Tax=Rhizobium sp. LjRoot258 TaxID=3342299 RepID=UPI003ECC84E5
MIGATVAHHSSRIIAKLLALAIFWIAIIFVRHVMLMITAAPRRTLLWMLVLEFLFPAVGDRDNSLRFFLPILTVGR